MLAGRKAAHRSWEIRQVNEMLTRIESHPLPFACTTKYTERLDGVTLRRFVFKLPAVSWFTEGMIVRSAAAQLFSLSVITRSGGFP